MTRKPAGKPGGLGIKKMTTKVLVVKHLSVTALQGVKSALWACTRQCSWLAKWCLRKGCVSPAG